MSKNSTPFFSVVIPTKNRSFAVGRAIQSVLAQTFSDFEIVISDNDDGPETQKIVQAIGDPRLKYFRTGGLDMPDNWEAGYARATGEYQLLLEDKSVLKPRALQRIADALKVQPAEIVSWPQDMFNDLLTPPTVSRAVVSGETVLYSSEEILRQFMSWPRGYFERTLPRGVNSCLHRELKRRILNGPTGRLCAPYSPDYTMAYLQLGFGDAVLHIDDCLTVYGSCRHSAGGRYLTGRYDPRDLKRDFQVDSASVFYTLVPIQARIMSNALYNEYLRMAQAVGGRLAATPIDPYHLFVEAWRDLVICKLRGNPSRLETAAWKRALRKQPRKVQRAVRLTLAREAKPFLQTVKKCARRLGFHHPWRLIKWTVGLPLAAPAGKEGPSFEDALNYVVWEAQQPQPWKGSHV